ncbi:hypothetical protein QBC46DRAFT_110420 [Diplogelasinospora grovesii]|uniref:Secreted protein n=1 Tax=Diplogelasinospora grovesii TaxID=303347 RepID=A0AAN6N9G7_9PEZI|nr:hypothetical protein QBC46DRAFT_110420 [Diplogelasinospora grovesii]
MHWACCWLAPTLMYSQSSAACLCLLIPGKASTLCWNTSVQFLAVSRGPSVCTVHALYELYGLSGSRVSTTDGDVVEPYFSAAAAYRFVSAPQQQSKSTFARNPVRVPSVTMK